jgi:RimJ/RimL family protein N-acetyltransferase
VPVEDRHADPIWEWTRDERFNKHVLWPQPQIPLQAKRFIDNALAAWDAGTAFSYFCELKDTGETLARVEARRSLRRHPLGEVGMLIAPQAWNHGLATELTYFGLWFCFENLELEAVSIDAGAGNTASNHLLRKLGMHFLGEQDFLMVDGTTRRLNRFVLTRDEFQVLMLKNMVGYGLPTELFAQSADGARIVEPVGEVGVVKPESAANAELL